MANSVSRVNQKDFARIPGPVVQRSVFNRSHSLKTAFDSGYLVPVYCDEILPGDTVNLRATFLARLTQLALVFPIMDNVYLDCFFFFAPNRLLWNNWEKFCGADAQAPFNTDYEIPVVVPDGFANPEFSFQSGDIYDYFGIPIGVQFAEADYPSALPFRAYRRIFSEWFRDENLQAQNWDPDTMMGDGPDVYTDNALLRRGKRHDYFTSCLPWPQKGDAVALPLGTFNDVPVVGDGVNSLGLTDGTDFGSLYGSSAAVALNANRESYGNAPGANATAVGNTPVSASGTLNLGVTEDPDNSGLIALTSTLAGVAATINDLREAIAVQHILERDARGGSRYVEQLGAHFGVVSPDFRLQRTEYLGGYSQPINVTPVPQTSGTQEGGPYQGTLAAHAQGISQAGFVYSAVEHGYIIGLAHVRADITYQQGLRRMWSRRTRFDFYWPDLAHLGEQAVLNKEIFFPNNDTAAANTVFGYQERWAEYRYSPSYVTGIMRSDAPASLERWHLALDFSSMPTLGDGFIQDNPPISRVLAVTNEPQVLLDVNFNVRHARPMPVYSVPGLQRL